MTDWQPIETAPSDVCVLLYAEGLRTAESRIKQLEAALRGLFDEIDSRFGSIADMSPELLDVMLQAKAALAPKDDPT